MRVIHQQEGMINSVLCARGTKSENGNKLTWRHSVWVSEFPTCEINPEQH